MDRKKRKGERRGGEKMKGRGNTQVRHQSEVLLVFPWTCLSIELLNCLLAAFDEAFFLITGTQHIVRGYAGLASVQ